MILNDIAEVLYAPQKVFKRIIENPKYLGALIILLLFMGLQIGYSYSQFSRTYTENTSPVAGNFQNYINATATSSTNVSLWRAGPGTTFSNNYVDFYNYSIYVPAIGANYSLFGNSSLEINATNTNKISAALSNAFNVNCSVGGFENLSMTLKMVEPQVAPQSVALTLYSINDSSYYSYDLTSALSNSTAIGLWNNLPIPVGPTAQGWTSAGTPDWANVTSLKLDFTYPSNSSISILIGALFFHGQYELSTQAFGNNLALSFIETYSLQFLFTWFLLTGIIYVFFKAFKANITWKPLFVALAFALFVMVIRSLVTLLASFALPTVYYPFDVSLGVTSNPLGAIYVPAQSAATFTAQSQAILNNIVGMTATFNVIVELMFVVSYVWLGALCTIIVGELKPEFSMTKRIVISAVSIAATLLLLLLLVGIV